MTIRERGGAVFGAPLGMKASGGHQEVQADL